VTSDFLVGQGPESYLRWARGEMGEREVSGPGANPRVVEYFTATSLRATSDEVAWCSAFANWSLRKGGVAGTNSASAMSFATWGIPCEPCLGCVMVIPYPGGRGHVGFPVGHTAANEIVLLGGNQSDSVCCKLVVRRPEHLFRFPAEMSHFVGMDLPLLRAFVGTTTSRLVFEDTR